MADMILKVTNLSLFQALQHNINSPNEYTNSYNILFTNYLRATILFLVLVQICVYSKNYYLKRMDKRNPVKNVLGLDDIPGPTFYWPNFIGCALKFLPYSNALKQVYKWSLEYPGIAKGMGGGKMYVALGSGPLLQQLFKSTESGHLAKAPIIYDIMKPFITNGVLVSTGKFWQAQRKIIMKSQSFQNLKAYMGIFNRHSKIFVGELEKMFADGQPHQISGEINILFLKVICEMITGLNAVGSHELGHYHHNFQIWKETLCKRVMNPWLLFNTLWKLHPMSKQHDKAVAEMTDFAQRNLAQHKEMRALEAAYNEQVNPDELPFRCLLDDLVDAGLQDDQIVDEMNTMIFGGHETGATAIHFFCFCMALNPEIQELCSREADELFENPDNFKNGLITYEALQSNLKYIERCILETLRLFPPIFFFIRELKTPLRLHHESKIYDLPIGVSIIVSPFTMHRDPIVFPKPDKFDPDRFLPDEMAKRHTYSYIPFSAGPRNCLGQKFAMVEMKMVAAYLLRRFEMRTTDRMEDIPLLPLTSLTPERDYSFQFKKRDVNISHELVMWK